MSKHTQHICTTRCEPGWEFDLDNILFCSYPFRLVYPTRNESYLFVSTESIYAAFYLFFAVPNRKYTNQWYTFLSLFWGTYSYVYFKFSFIYLLYASYFRIISMEALKWEGKWMGWAIEKIDCEWICLWLWDDIFRYICQLIALSSVVSSKRECEGANSLLIGIAYFPFHPSLFQYVFRHKNWLIFLIRFHMNWYR